ncbi:XrtA system polysaccharide deacetylase [Kordiimonas pumila]|uniref:Chitooligosaccharide deacetylase n=1 Tax=Kordiimonas pumila TaxID=2161677 RepID=A0ABV7D243_9PROT|nr:XrtA system polysaccharide deacetylase [Kordiimonas pumila]
MKAKTLSASSFKAPIVKANALSGTFAFTVDVEEWFQVGAFETTFTKADWPSLESRVELQTLKLLDFMRGASIKGTFFCLGWVAEKYPSLLKAIVNDGHEIACHGLDHDRLFTMSKADFKADIQRSKGAIEDVTGVTVIGYRAPSFSLTPNVWWVYDLLDSEGFKYSSSLYPVKTDHYGMESAPRAPFYPANSSIVEIPMTVCDVPFRRLPASGGGYFRLMPYWLSRYLLRNGAKQSSAPAIFYMHPWEMDTDQPYVKEAPLLSRFRHYQGQARLPAKLTRLAKDFSWGRMQDIYENILTEVKVGK